MFDQALAWFSIASLKPCILLQYVVHGSLEQVLPLRLHFVPKKRASNTLKHSIKVAFKHQLHRH